MIFLDTTFLVDLLRGKETATSWLSNATDQALFTSEINIFELYTGLFRIGKKHSKTLQKRREEELEGLLSHIEVLDFERKSAIESARILADLLNRGVPAGARDVMIAGTALSRGIKRILTRNIKNFKQIRKIKVESY